MMKKNSLLLLCSLLLVLAGAGGCKKTEKMKEVQLITLDPGHFHAALVQKTSYPQVSDEVYVYAPEGDDLQEHLKKVEAYNTRNDSPTRWKETVYTGDDFLEKMLAEKKGNVMVTAGNNGRKTEYILKTLQAGIHVLADKPMVIVPEQFDLLKSCFDAAREKNVLLYDIMTERYEVTTQLQREFSMQPEIFGRLEEGTPDNPAVTKESVHHFFKTVSGNPLKRPAWFFDVEQQGEGIVDVATHLVDLVQWECFPEQMLDYTKDIELIRARHWTTPLDLPQFTQSTGLDNYPDYLKKDVVNDTLQVYSNGEIIYRLKGICAKVSVIWNYEAPAGAGDTHYSIMRGTKANLIIRQGAEQQYIPALYIEISESVNLQEATANLEKNFPNVEKKYPGVTLKKLSDRAWEVQVPQHYHNGHEAHFGQVTENFLQYLHDGKLPEWEVPNMIAKYYTTTQALKMAKE
ncbi:MAG: Gfo/Idh/MocA family oxidoreductase [Tannerella sp.]|jgi:predicted dehydrogenase|nr:Gfo/Idh/MocA family oxidoreductase [Tannerella sp.]